MVFSSCISQEELQSYLIDQILGDEIDNSENNKEISIVLENSPTPFPTTTPVPKFFLIFRRASMQETISRVLS